MFMLLFLLGVLLSVGVCVWGRAEVVNMGNTFLVLSAIVEKLWGCIWAGDCKEN